jgi:putative nucleotidyltransferase with HDIG domain
MEKTGKEASSAALAIAIVRELRARGHRAYLVGGCVRDRLLGSNPKDYDVATDARPENLLVYFPESDRVGAHFGVVLVRDASGTQVEVATFRSDVGYSDGRRPDQVVFESDPKQDALRRDFTINALFEDPLTGEVLDFVGGREDLASGIIRAIGDARHRFREDHLRMLRAVRFAARLQFSIEAGTLGAIQELAGFLANVSAERIRNELIRILTEGHARRGMELLDESGLLSVILPEVKALQGVEQPPQYHPEGDVWTHTLMMLDMLDQPSATLAMGVLLHDIGKPPTFSVAERIRFDGHVEAGVAIARGILERLRFSRGETDEILALIQNHMRFKDVMQMKPSTLKRFLRMPSFDEHLKLHRVDCLASHGNLASWTYAKEHLARLPAEELHPRPLITGQDLIAQGYRPGPAFGKALEAVETAQLDGRVKTRDEALELAKETFERYAAPPPVDE